MLNHIWAFLIVIGILMGLGTALRNAQQGVTETKIVNGQKVSTTRRFDTPAEKLESISKAGEKLTKDAVNAAAFTYTDPATGKERQGAVGISVGLIGIMALWLGFMRIAELSGLIALLARAISPLFQFIFPTIPKNHPAQGSILMNIAANMLGLDNAATPLGIKAMKELQKLNGEKETASNAMCMFLALNVSSLTLLPATVIALRVQNQSISPTTFLPAMWIATGAGKLAAFFGAKLGERFSRDTRPATAEEIAAAEAAEGKA